MYLVVSRGAAKSHPFGVTQKATQSSTPPIIIAQTDLTRIQAHDFPLVLFCEPFTGLARMRLILWIIEELCRRDNLS